MDNVYNLIKSRHSVRSYSSKKLKNNVREELEKLIIKCNDEGNLNIKLVVDEPEAFNTFMAHYGNFTNVNNYIVMSGKNQMI